MEILNADLERRSLPLFLKGICHLLTDFCNDIFNTPWMDTSIGIPLPLDTVRHASEKELLGAVRAVIAEKKIDHVIVGLPKLPSGEEGAQAAMSRSVGAQLLKNGSPVQYVDERYSSPRSSQHKHAIPASKIDGDAAAACSLIQAAGLKDDPEKHI